MTTMPRPGDEDASTGKSIGAVYDIWNRQVRTFDDSDSDGVLWIMADEWGWHRSAETTVKETHASASRSMAPGWIRDGYNRGFIPAGGPFEDWSGPPIINRARDRTQ